MAGADPQASERPDDAPASAEGAVVDPRPSGQIGAEERATLLLRAVAPLLSFANVVAVLAATVLAVDLVIVTRAVPWPLAVVVAGLIGGLVAIVGGALTVPPATRAAYEAFGWLGHIEIERVRARTGSSPPGDPDGLQAWLDEHPASDATRPARIEVLAFLGAFDEARSEIEATRASGREDDLLLATTEQYLEFLETGRVDLTGIESAVEAAPPGSPGRLEGEVALALATARERLAAGRADWTDPLVAVRPRLGTAATRVALADTWRPAFVGVSAIALLVAAIVRWVIGL